MDRKFLLAASVMIALAVAAIFFYAPPFQEKGAAVLPSDAWASAVSFSFGMEGCLGGNVGEGDGGAKRGGGENERPAEIALSGNFVVYSRSLSHNCCRNATVGHEETVGADGSRRIDFLERWAGEDCRCMCFSKISASVGNLLPGNYTVNAWEKKDNSTKLLASANVTVG